jgi:hypothetical protein
MRVSHRISAVFDDPNLVSCAGLVPVLRLAERAGLRRLIDDHVHLDRAGGANAAAKVTSLVAGMVAGADSIDDMDLLRHGGLPRLLADGRAPSTLGTFLRAFTFGHVGQLDAVARRLLASLAAATPVLPGLDRVAFVDVDDTVRATHGNAKQGVGFGYSGVEGLNALLATVSTPMAAPLLVGARLRGGSASSARGAVSFVDAAVRTARAAGATGMLIVRTDAAFYSQAIATAALAHGAYFSFTVKHTGNVISAISRVPDQAWTPIRYPNAIWDDAERRWISDAEVAEVPFTAFRNYGKQGRITARLIVRRVRRLNPTSNRDQGELFAAYRYHALFTNSPLPTLEAERCHRGHAVIEQVIADLKAGPLAHLPSGKFAANAAWLSCATIAFNLTRAAGAIASAVHAKATTATLRTQLIQVPARIARSARRLRLHLPTQWPWADAWTRLFSAAHAPPTTA